MEIEADDIWAALHTANGMMLIAEQHGRPKTPIEWRHSKIEEVAT